MLLRRLNWQCCTVPEGQGKNQPKTVSPRMTRQIQYLSVPCIVSSLSSLPCLSCCHRTTKSVDWRKLHPLSQRLASLGIMGSTLRAPLKPSMRQSAVMISEHNLAYEKKIQYSTRQISNPDNSWSAYDSLRGYGGPYMGFHDAVRRQCLGSLYQWLLLFFPVWNYYVSVYTYIYVSVYINFLPYKQTNCCLGQDWKYSFCSDQLYCIKCSHFCIFHILIN